jgi:anti-sigma B factor antagonist
LDPGLELSRVRQVELPGKDNEHDTRVVGRSLFELEVGHHSQGVVGEIRAYVHDGGVWPEGRAGTRTGVHETGGSRVAIGDFRIEEDAPGRGVVVLAIHGETDLYVVNELRSHLSAALGQGVPALVVDLSDVGFIDSIGLGALVGGMKRAQARGGDFRLVVPEGNLRRIFEMTLLDRVFALYPTREAALAAAGSSTPGG